MPGANMKKIIFCLALIILLFPALSFAGCLVEMKNGHKFVSSECWEENDQVMLYLYGGKVGFHQGLVKEIKKISGSVEGQAVPASQPVQEKEISVGKTADRGPVEATAPTTEKKPTPVAATVLIDPGLESALQSGKKALEIEKIQATTALNDAKKSGDKQARQAALDKLTDVNVRLDALRNKILETYNGKLPNWWNEQK